MPFSPWHPRYAQAARSSGAFTRLVDNFFQLVRAGTFSVLIPVLELLAAALEDIDCSLEFCVRGGHGYLISLRIMLDNASKEDLIEDLIELMEVVTAKATL